MASPSGSGSGSGMQMQEVIDQSRKRKRMLSNRESARRSRQRKQKHLDELTELVAQLENENGQIAAAIEFNTHNYLGVEAENSVLRTQMLELSSRLESLNEILGCIGMRQWSLMGLMNQQPIMVSVVDS